MRVPLGRRGVRVPEQRGDHLLPRSHDRVARPCRGSGTGGGDATHTGLFGELRVPRVLVGEQLVDATGSANSWPSVVSMNRCNSSARSR